MLGETGLCYLMQGIRQQWPWAEDCQVTVECNPEDVSTSLLSALQESGVSRLSLGVQSFQTQHLKSLGRNHTLQHLQSALEALRQCRWLDFNLDLMFGYPDQNIQDFQQDLYLALSWNPTHLSLYALELHANTPFGHDPKIRQQWEGCQEETEQMYLWAVDHLRQLGWEHYEVSNFARPGFAGRMNQLVWSGQSYLGIGVGAHSYDGQSRWANVRSLQRYSQALQRRQAPLDFLEQLTAQQQANEFLMLQLRQPQGLDWQMWETKAPKSWWPEHQALLQAWAKEGLVEWTKERLALTPRGLLVADALTVDLSL